jgi:peptide chain release factor 3
MVLDAAKGIEEQTRKLFEVCRLRDVPIITFVNKLGREARDPFDLLDEIEQSLALDVTPASWPIGMGRDFLGTYDLLADAPLLFERGVYDRVTEPVRCNGLDDRNCRGCCRKRRSPNCARRTRRRRGSPALRP